MKKLAWIISILILSVASAHGQATVTPNVGFQIPSYQQTNWQVPINYNFNRLDIVLGGSTTLQSGTTPTLSAFSNYVTNNTTPTTITNFLGGYPGQSVVIICGDTNTTIGATANISITAPIPCASGISARFTLIGSIWYASVGTPGPAGSAGPAGPPGTLSSNSGITVGGSAIIKGTDPFADIAGFGARPVNGAGPSTTATLVASSPNVTLAAASTFQNSDGITFYNAGATLTLATPPAPTVLPSIAIQGSGLGGGTSIQGTVASGTGSSAYAYSLVARTKYGGHTATGSITTIANGLATIGKTSCTITTLSRSGTAVTVDFSATCAGAVAKARIHITGASSPDFDGYYNVSTVNSGTEVVLLGTPLDGNSFGWQSTDSTSGTGGTANFLLGNHISWPVPSPIPWEYYVCAKRLSDSTFYLIGVTKPNSNGLHSGQWYDLQFDDYGHTYMDSQLYPPYVETGTDTPNSDDAVCNGAAATNDPLTTTIVSGAGTTSIVVNNAAVNSSSGQAAIFDDGPTILAAANSITPSLAAVSGSVYIPPAAGGTGCYPINSYTLLPVKVHVIQAGCLTLNETLVTNGTPWDGSWSNNGIPQGGLEGTAQINVGYANPGISNIDDGTNFYHIAISTNQTNGGVAIADDACFSQYNYTSINVGGSVNRIGIPLVLRGAYSGGECTHTFTNSIIQAGPIQAVDSSWTPGIYLPAPQNGSGALFGNQGVKVEFINSNLYIRGIEEDVAGGYCGDFTINGGFRQGGINPLLAINNSVGLCNSNIHVGNFTQDTEAIPTVSLNSGVGATIDLDTPQNASTDTGGIPPPISGNGVFNFVRSLGTQFGKLPNDVGRGTCAVALDCQFSPLVLGGNGTYVYAPLGTPAAPTASAATSGGTLSAGTYQFGIAAIGPDGHWSLTSPISNAITVTGGSGNFTIPLSWTALPGATGGYELFACGIFSTCPSMRDAQTVLTGTSANISHIGAGVNSNTYSQAGASGLAPALIFAPTVEATNIYQLNGATTASSTAPTILAAGCGGSAASVPNANGTTSFTVNVGTSNSGSCTITMPTLTGVHGWNCSATDQTTISTTVANTRCVTASATSITIANYSDVAGAHPWVDNDLIGITASPY